MLNIPSRDAPAARLRTPRLSLIPAGPQAGTKLYAAIEESRAELDPWLPWVPFQVNLRQTVAMLTRNCSEWDAGTALRFVIWSAEPMRDIQPPLEHPIALGIVGLDMCNAHHRSCDLGYWMRTSATGRGLMTEAARACLDFAFRTVGMHRVRVAAATDNQASLRVIEHLGFIHEGRSRHAEWCAGRWLDHQVFALLESDWG